MPGPRRADPAARVVFVAGAAKSGSTLLGSLLGQLPGFFNVGELNLFWTTLAEGDRRCGCGATIPDCAFWSRVLGDLEGEGVDFARMAALEGRLDRTRHLGRVALRRLGVGRDDWEALRIGTRRLYRSVYARSGGEWLVDVSKLTTHLLLLRELPEIDLRLLHLVRDGRAVAYSWQRRRLEVSAAGTHETSLRQHRSAPRDLGIWMLQNFLTDAVASRCRHRARIQYEALAAAPEQTLGTALAALGLEWPAAGALLGGLRLEPTHSIAGAGKVRFARPGTEIAVDDAWRRELSPATIRRWSILAAPGLRRFGYPRR